MQKRLLMGSLAACAVIFLSGSAAFAAENWIGTWKLDTAKSKFSPGPAPKSMTATFAATPDGIKFSADAVDAEGNASHTEFVSKFDGQEVPYMGNPNADTASPKKINDNSYDNPWKKDGKPTMTSHAVVSKDGKTFTVHQTGKNAKGEVVNTTVVFNKIPVAIAKVSETKESATDKIITKPIKDGESTSCMGKKMIDGKQCTLKGAETDGKELNCHYVCPD